MHSPDSIGKESAPTAATAPARAASTAVAAMAAVAAELALRAFAQVRFVLVEPSHVGNIGASARALRSMGFSHLVVVAPPDQGFRDAPQARALAAGAADVLAAAAVCANLTEALQGVGWAYATTGYARQFAPAPLDVRVAAQRGAAALLAQPLGLELAFVFGPERTGLANADVQRCHQCCSIPADPLRASLNLSQAVQVVAYETRRALCSQAGLSAAAPARRDPAAAAPRALDPVADVEQTEALFAHLAQALAAIGFLDPAQPKHLLARLRRFVLRAQPTITEVALLRGVASAMILPRRLRAGRKQGDEPGA